MKLLNVTRWEKQRSKGVRHFVLVTGILCFGLPITALFAVLEYWRFQSSGLFSLIPTFRGEFLRISALIVLLGGPLLGMVWASLTWKLNEWLYRRYAT
jgi:hypothetical protein